MGRPGGRTMIAASAICVVLGITLAGTAALPLALVTLAVTALWSATARARLGGQTGDILGAAQHIVETAALLTLVTSSP